MPTSSVHKTQERVLHWERTADQSSDWSHYCHNPSDLDFNPSPKPFAELLNQNDLFIARALGIKLSRTERRNSWEMRSCWPESRRLLAGTHA